MKGVHPLRYALHSLGSLLRVTDVTNEVREAVGHKEINRVT